MTDLLGPDVTIGATFSTSSSSSNINGVKTSNMMLQCACTGSRGQGVVAIRGQSSGDQVAVASLQVQANGQMFDVPTLRGGGGGGGGGGQSSSGGATRDSGGVIDVDVIAD